MFSEFPVPWAPSSVLAVQILSWDTVCVHLFAWPAGCWGSVRGVFSEYSGFLLPSFSPFSAKLPLCARIFLPKQPTNLSPSLSLIISRFLSYWPPTTQSWSFSSIFLSLLFFYVYKHVQFDIHFFSLLFLPHFISCGHMQTCVHSFFVSSPVFFAFLPLCMLPLTLPHPLMLNHHFFDCPYLKGEWLSLARFGCTI